MIIGHSNKGKSVIINSFVKLIYNRPLGKEWRSWNGGKSEITVDTKKSKVTLFQDKGNIRYRVDDGKEFMAHGSTEIEDIFGLDRKVNIGLQLEKTSPIFLLSESPGGVAKHFNKIAGIYQINTTLDNGKKEVKVLTQKGRNLTEIIKEKKEELKTYDWVERSLEKVSELIEKERDLKNIQDQIEGIEEESQKTTNIIKRLSRKKEELLIKEPVKKAEELYNKKEVLSKRIEEIEKTKDSIKKTLKKIENNKKKLTIKPRIYELLKTFNNLDKYQKEYEILFEKKERIRRTKEKLKTTQRYLKETRKKFNEEFPDECPLCGSVRR